MLMAEIVVEFVHCQIFGGQIYKFLSSSVGHAPFILVRRQSLVLQPLPTVVRSLGGRGVVFTRLCGFRIGAARDGHNSGFSPWLVVLVVIEGFWRSRVDGFVSGGGTCAAHAVTGGGFSNRQLLC
jgi:hypothetical protein